MSSHIKIICIGAINILSQRNCARHNKYRLFYMAYYMCRVQNNSWPLADFQS